MGSRDEACHAEIRARVIDEAHRIARRFWPAASEDLIRRMVARALRGAALEADPSGLLSGDEEVRRG